MAVGGLAALLVLVLGAAPAVATAALEREMREIASGLRCPVCQNLSVADSPSEMAREMRALILDELRAGKRPEEIRAYFVSKYGEWILLAPTPRGFALLVWILPGLGALAGLGGVVWVLRRWTRRGRSLPLPPPDEAFLARIRAAVEADDPPVALTPEEARLVEGLREIEFDYRAGKLSAGDYQDLRTLYEARAVAVPASSKEAAEIAEPRVLLPAPATPDRPGPRPRVWRLVGAALFLVGFGAAIGFFLPRSVRVRGTESITGDLLTGTRSEAIPANPGDLGALLAEGRKAMEAQDFGRAIGLFTRALKVDPDEPTAHASLGLILHRGGHPDKALEAFDRALAREPTMPQALWGRGLVLYESMGRTAEAIRTWEMLLAQGISQEDRDHVLSVLAEARGKLAGRTTPLQKPAR